MNPKEKNPDAVRLGRLAKGKPKHYSKDEIAKRRERIKLAQAKRWAHKPQH